MLKNIVIFGSLPCRQTFLAVSIRGKRTKPPYPKPLENFCKDLDKDSFLFQYENVSELDNAPERVKKLFTVEYGTLEDKRLKKTHDLIRKIDMDNQCIDKVTELVERTMLIKELQQKYLQKRRKNFPIVLKIIEQVKIRQKHLDNLRDHHFEVYARALQFLDLQHYFSPQYNVRATELADQVADMRIRAFAESRRLTAVADKRKNKLLKLKDEYIKELSSKDNV